GEYTISYQFLGFQTEMKKIVLDKDLRIDIELGADSQNLQEVVVTAEREDQNITRNEGSVITLDMKSVKALPALGGEPDILKIIQSTPGVKTAGEGNSGFYVRGGGLDQNLILLDEALVYNPSHLLGFFSVFNGDALKNTELYKGGMSAEYGGRTSSVMDIRMKDGNNKQFAGSGGIGLIASRLTLEAPIVKDKGSFIVSGRRTYADLFLKLSNDPSVNQNVLFFYDANVKANYRISDKDRIIVSGYTGRDKLGFQDQFGFTWGNITSTIRWNHLFSDRLFSNTTLLFSNYDYSATLGGGEEEIGLESVIEDFSLKQDFSYFPDDKNEIKFGFNLIDHTLEPGNLNAGPESGFSSEKATPLNGLEGAVYIQNSQQLSSRLNVNYGIRYSFLQRFGSGTQLALDENRNITGQQEFGPGERMSYQGGFEPRLSANFSLDKSSSLKLGFNKNYQYIHLLTSATSSSPLDTWIMSGKNIKPQIADQISLGYFRNFGGKAYETSVEVYYKDMQHVIDYRTGANVFFNDEVEADLLSGDGESYGAEFFVKKNNGKLTGWLSYTLSWTDRRFNEINNGQRFPARQDRRHDVSLVALYKISESLTFTGNFSYYTGDAVTFPSGQYQLDGASVPLYSERNGNRAPAFHRMDVGLTWDRPKKGRFESSWNFSLYNVYARQNFFIIDFGPSEDVPNVNEAVQTSLFTIVPSVTYNFKF
ncbi:MAG: TonB-dependent receptor plug domain-containing protein, partial [Bacteroidota bacterium]